MKKTLITLLIAFALIFSGVGLVEAQSPMSDCELVREIEYDGHTFSPEADGGYGADKDIGQEGGADPGVVEIDHGDGVGAVVCMINTINRGAQILFYIMMGIVVALVVYGGFLILTSGGSEEKVGKGKKFITYAVIGVFVAVFAYAVPAILTFVT